MSRYTWAARTYGIEWKMKRTGAVGLLNKVEEKAFLEFVRMADTIPATTPGILSDIWLARHVGKDYPLTVADVQGYKGKVREQIQVLRTEAPGTVPIYSALLYALTLTENTMRLIECEADCELDARLLGFHKGAVRQHAAIITATLDKNAPIGNFSDDMRDIWMDVADWSDQNSGKHG